MQCKSCKFENSISARFCSSCANPLLDDEDILSASEITLDWLINTITKLGYKVDSKNDRDEKANSFLAIHEEKPNLHVTLKTNLFFIGFSAAWNIRKAAWWEKLRYLNIANKANAVNWLCTFSMDKAMDGCRISSFLYITEKLSNRDIAAFLDTFLNGVENVLDASGVRELAN